MMGVCGEAMDTVPQDKLDLAEQLFFGEVGEFVGHVAGSLMEQGLDASEDGLNTGLAL